MSPRPPQKILIRELWNVVRTCWQVNRLGLWTQDSFFFLTESIPHISVSCRLNSRFRRKFEYFFLFESKFLLLSLRRFRFPVSPQSPAYRSNSKTAERHSVISRMSGVSMCLYTLQSTLEWHLFKTVHKQTVQAAIAQGRVGLNLTSFSSQVPIDVTRTRTDVVLSTASL